MLSLVSLLVLRCDLRARATQFSFFLTAAGLLLGSSHSPDLSVIGVSPLGSLGLYAPSLAACCAVRPSQASSSACFLPAAVLVVTLHVVQGSETAPPVSIASLRSCGAGLWLPKTSVGPPRQIL